MGVLYGPAGSGKTFAAALAGRDLEIARVNVQFPSRPTMLHVAQHLTRAVTGTLPPRRRNRFELSDELIEALADDEPRLIVVDEAQWLNRECIEYLRHLHDHPDTRFALLLVGGDGCWEVLSREPMLRSRIHRQVRFDAMELATVLEVIPRYHPVYADTPAEVIADIDDRYAHGIFRHWAKLHAQRHRARDRTAERPRRPRPARAARHRATRGVTRECWLLAGAHDDAPTIRWLHACARTREDVLVIAPTPAGAGRASHATSCARWASALTCHERPAIPPRCSRAPTFGYARRASPRSSYATPTDWPQTRGATSLRSGPTTLRSGCSPTPPR